MPSDHIPPPPAYAPHPAGPSYHSAGPSPEGAYATSYDARPARAGLDRGTKRLVLAACGLGAVLAAVVGGWAMRGGDRPVPVFEADGRPLRVKPENPGGMQVAGLDELEGKAAGMAPKPEAPSPQALRAQLPPNPNRSAPNAASGADPASSPPAISRRDVGEADRAAPPAAAVQPAPAPSTSPQSTSPQSTRPSAAPSRPTAPAGVASGSAPGAAASAPAAPAPDAPAAAALVQLAAVASEQAAQAEWQRLAKRMPELLGGRKPMVQRVDRDGRTIWRVRTGGFADLAEAAGFCGRVRAKGASCSIAAF